MEKASEFVLFWDPWTVGLEERQDAYRAQCRYENSQKNLSKRTGKYESNSKVCTNGRIKADVYV